MRRARDLLALLLACACLPASAHAAQPVSLHVAFTPERLGHATSIDFNVRITPPADSVPSPLTKIDMRYPSTIGLAVSGLGLMGCSEATLEAFGPDACPADSRMGEGSALAEIPIGPDIVHETSPVAIVRAPEEDGHIGMLFYASGETPVDAQIAFPGLLVASSTSGDESIHINVPLVPSLPGGPDVAVIGLNATFGPRGLTYYEHVHGKLVAYRPEGILLPDRCPHGGFVFGATLAFLDGSHTRAHTVVPCPSTPRRRFTAR